MTFSQEVKSEVLKLMKNIKGCCVTSFLTAVIKSIGSLTLDFRKFYFTIESDNHDFLTLCKNLAKTHLNVNAKIESYNVNAKGIAVYSCIFEDNIGDKLSLTKHEDDSLQLCDDCDILIPENECCKRSFMQGLFLSAGSVVIPATHGSKYHLELRLSNGQFASAVHAAYSQFDFRRLERKNHSVLYLKDSEKISDFLAYMGATRGKLKLETVIVDRDMRNAINRQSNCIVANIDKAVRASERQLAAIAQLKESGVYANLPQPLKEIAELRLQHPESTLDEIAALLKISKSGANHRFAKLVELANLEENK